MRCRAPLKKRRLELTELMLQLHLHTPHPRLGRDQTITLLVRAYELLRQYPRGLDVVLLRERFELGPRLLRRPVELASALHHGQIRRATG